MPQSAQARSGVVFAADLEGREPFAAYLVDEATQAAVQTIVAQRGWSSSNIRKGGLATALRLLGVAPPPRFLMVDVDGLPIEEIEAGLVELTRLGTMVVAIGGVNDVNYFRRIMRTGARDYLIKPVDSDLVGEVFVRLEQPGDGSTPLGRVVGIIGARGGVGVTTISINTAWLMAERLSRRTALVDMDIYAGTIALALDIEPTRGLREAFDDPERVDQVFLQNAMTRIGKNLHVLATEEAFDDTVRMNDSVVVSLAETMRANFDMTVLDIPRHFVLREPQLFSHCDAIVIVTELTLQSLRDANRLSKLLHGRNRKSKILTVANQVVSKPDVTVKEFEDGLENKLRGVFSHELKAMSRANLKGMPLAGSEPKHRMISDLHRLCIELAGVPEETKVGFFARRFGRK